MGDESLRWNTLLSSLLTLGKELEELGFVYINNTVVAIEQEELMSLDAV